MGFIFTLLFSVVASASNAPGWTASPQISYQRGIGPWTNELSLSDDGKYLAFLGASGEIGVTNTSNLKTHYPDPEQIDSSYRTHISFMPIGHHLLIGGDSSIGYLYADTNQLTMLPFGHVLGMIKLLGGPDYYHMIGNLVPNPNGGSFISLDEFHDPLLWSFHTLIPSKILKVGRFRKAAYDSSGKFLIAGDAKVSVVDVEKNVIVKELMANQTVGSVDDVQTSGSCVAVAHDFDGFPEDKTPAVEILDFKSGKSIAHFEFKGAQVLDKGPFISLDGSCKTMLITLFSQGAKLMDIASGKELATFSEHLTDSDQEADANHISAGVISKDGKTVAIGYRKIMIFKKQ